MDATGIVILMAGSVLLLLYGLRLTTDALRSLTGGRLHAMLRRIADRPAPTLIGGFLAGSGFQSSSGITLLLTSLTEARFVSPRQALTILLGANVGATLIVHLVALRLTEHSLLICGIGILLILTSRGGMQSTVGQTILGIGFVFLALHTLSSSTAPLRESPLVQATVQAIGAAPLLVIIFAFIVTAVTMSGAATLALAIVWLVDGIITPDIALLMVIGVNLGTIGTVLVATAQGSAVVRRIAAAFGTL